MKNLLYTSLVMTSRIIPAKFGGGTMDSASNSSGFHDGGTMESASNSSGFNNDASSSQEGLEKVLYVRLHRLTPQEIPNYENGGLENPARVPHQDWAWCGDYSLLTVVTKSGAKRKCKCYIGAHHSTGTPLRVGDCAFIKSNTNRPYIGKIESLYEVTGKKMASIKWFYWPEETLNGRRRHQDANEIYSSEHRDVVNLDCIDDTCFVLDYHQHVFQRVARQNCELCLREHIVLDENNPRGKIFYYRKSYNHKNGKLY